MELILERIAKRKTYTIGHLYIAKESTAEVEKKLPGLRQPLTKGLQICDTLEPTWRDYAHGAYKVKGRSAIPEGRYAVVISFSPKMQKWLPILLGVPMFSGIRIHAGNTSNDTEGCILVGQNLKKCMVLNSNIWLKRLKDKIVAAKDKGEPVWITIK